MGMGMNKGFTLVELLVTLVISGLLMTAIYTAFKAQQDSYLAQEQVVEIQQNLRAGLDILVHELRMAGYDVDQTGVKTGTAGITVANANNITFTLVADDDGIDNDNADGDNDSTTGADEPGELKTIQYRLYDAGGDGDNDLGRLVGTVAGNIRAVAENVENLEFVYLDSAGAVTATLPDIRSVQISILARAARPDRSFTSSQSYTTLSGAVWGPYADNFRRRFQTVTVQCRNMGL